MVVELRMTPRSENVAAAATMGAAQSPRSLTVAPLNQRSDDDDDDRNGPFLLLALCVLLFVFYLYSSWCMHPLPLVLHSAGGEWRPAAATATVASDAVERGSPLERKPTLRSSLLTNVDSIRRLSSSAAASLPLLGGGSNYSLTRHPLFPPPFEPSLTSAARDSLGEHIVLSGSHGDVEFRYTVCVLRNVCVGNEGVWFRFSNLTQHAHYTKLLAHCYAPNSNRVKAAEQRGSGPSICSCFHATNRGMVMPYAWQLDEEGKPTEQPAFPDPMRFVSRRTDPSVKHEHRHYWAVHKWVHAHHFAHWAQKLLLWQALSQHWSQLASLRWLHSDLSHAPSSAPAASDWSDHLLFPSLPAEEVSEAAAGESDQGATPQVQGLVFQDSESDLTEHEMLFLRMATLSALGGKHPITRALFRNETGEIELQHRSAPTHEERLQRVQAVLRQPHLQQHLIFGQDLYRGRFRTDRAPNEESDSGSGSWNNPRTGAATPPWSTCFERLSFAPAYARFADHAADQHAWRRNALQFLNLPSEIDAEVAPQVARGHSLEELLDDSAAADSSSAVARAHLPPVKRVSRCPPRRAIFLTRSNRAVQNRSPLLSWILSRFKLRVEVVTLNETTPAREQAALFASAGLVLSSHSSQLANVVFSHPGSCVIELAAEFYNADFASYARSAGVHFRYALGGRIHPPREFVPSDAHVECVRLLNSLCDGDGLCVLRRGGECAPRHGANKRRSFFADLPQVQRQVERCVQHLDQQCYGKWRPA